MSMIKCVECNSNISDKAKVCPHCGCPVNDSVIAKKSQINKRILISVIITLSVAVVVIGIFVSVNAVRQNRIRSGLYNGMDWGISKEKIEKSISGDYIDNSDRNCILNKVCNYEGIEGLTGAEIYDYENGLNRVSILLTLEDDSIYSDKAVVDKLLQIYDKRFGEHTNNSYSYQWTTDKTVIKLSYVSHELILLSYDDKKSAD